MPRADGNTRRATRRQRRRIATGDKTYAYKTKGGRSTRRPRPDDKNET